MENRRIGTVLLSDVTAHVCDKPLSEMGICGVIWL